MQLHKLNAAALVALGLTLAACGAPEGNDGSAFTSGKAQKQSGFGDSADATAVPAPAAPVEAPAAPHDEMCDGVALHGEHDACDEDDEIIVEAKALEPAPAAPAAPAAPVANPVDTVKDKPMPAPAPAAPAPAAPAPAPAPAPVPAKDPNIVEFRIKAGTGTSGWNAQAELVSAKVGQTVRIVNDDTVNHRLHTNGAPCPHGNNIAPGASFDCKITKAYDRAANGDIYDHIAGDDAVFFLKAVK